MKITENAKNYVKELFQNENIKVESTDFGKFKQEIYKNFGVEFFQRYDNVINYVYQEKFLEQNPHLDNNLILNLAKKL